MSRDANIPTPTTEAPTASIAPTNATPGRSDCHSSRPTSSATSTRGLAEDGHLIAAPLLEHAHGQELLQCERVLLPRRRPPAPLSNRPLPHVGRRPCRRRLEGIHLPLVWAARETGARQLHLDRRALLLSERLAEHVFLLARQREPLATHRQCRVTRRGPILDLRQREDQRIRGRRRDFRYHEPAPDCAARPRHWLPEPIPACRHVLRGARDDGLHALLHAARLPAHRLDRLRRVAGEPAERHQPGHERAQPPPGPLRLVQRPLKRL